MLFALWATARATLFWLQLPPLVQGDSFWYQPFSITIKNPHYPVLYGVFLRAFDFTIVIALQHLMVLAAALVSYRVGRAAFSRFGGLLTGAFVAVYPGFLLYAHTFMSETTFIFFIAMHLGALWLALEKRSPRWFLVAGLLVGTACLVRPLALLQPLAVALALLPVFRRQISWKRIAVSSIAFLIGYATVVLPVAAVVQRHYGKLTISNGRYPIAVDRMLLNPDLPVGAVRTRDPELARIRDYLAYEYDPHRNTLDDIRVRIDGPATPIIRLDERMTALWMAYIATHSRRYVVDSLSGIWEFLKLTEELDLCWQFSRSMLDGMSNTKAVQSHFLLALRNWPEPDAVRFRRYASWFSDMHRAMAYVYLELAVLALAAFVGIFLRGNAGILVRYVLISIVPMYMVPFFLGTPQVRYRYPLDFFYAVLLGGLGAVAVEAFTPILILEEYNIQPESYGRAGMRVTFY